MMIILLVVLSGCQKDDKSPNGKDQSLVEKEEYIGIKFLYHMFAIREGAFECIFLS